MLMTVRNIMVRVEECLPAGATLAEARSYWKKYGVGTAPLTGTRGELAGVVPQEKILQSLSENFDLGLPAVEFVDPRPICVPPEAAIEKLWPLPGNYAVVISREGKVLGLLSVQALDKAYAFIADRRLKELDAAISCAHNGIIAIDANGKITLFNPAAERMSRVASQNALGNYYNEVLVPTGLMDVMKTGQTQLSVKYQLGRRKYITNRSPIVQDGKVVGAVGVFQDVSEIEFISEELSTVKRLNGELMTILDSSYDGILICDRDGNILRNNQAFLRITGFPPGEFSSRRVQDLFENNMLGEVLRNKRSTSFIEKRKKDMNDLLVTCTPVMDEDMIVERIVINVRDITELTRLKMELDRTKELSRRYHMELAELRALLKDGGDLIVNSASMTKVLDLMLRVAKVDSTVLILGESGVGKEVIAQAIHNNSPRCHHPFIKINCGSIPEALLESELFGYEAGAFTGAGRHGKPGLFELADKGTLLLDEIGDLPLGLQVKLLRVLQEKEIIRVGGVKSRKIDIRFLAATNVDLARKVKEKAFRKDLFFRLNVVPISIPPLRERRDDIIPLVQRFQKKFEQQYGLKKQLSGEALDRLLQYEWPGNVRELENIVEFLYVTVGGQVIKLEDLPWQIRERAPETQEVVQVNEIVPLKKAVSELERKLIQRAMRQYNSTKKVASMLKVDQSTIIRKLQRIKREE